MTGTQEGSEMSRMRTMVRGTGRKVAFVAGLAVIVGVFDLLVSERHGFFDLRVYSGAMDYWVNHGGMMYDYLKPGTLYGFTYPPFAAMLMLPMAYVSWPVAMVTSVAASLLATAVVIWWLIDPLSRRQGWPRWFGYAVTLCLVAAYEPMRETINFGQVNMLLLALVAADALWLVARGHPLAGVGIGLATAIKLTPGIFIVYLLVTRRWRAALAASGTAAVVSLIAGFLAPDASREFWTTALWNTDRVGSLAFVSNQSLQGAVARLFNDDPTKPVWLLLVLIVLVTWAVRARAAARSGDEPAAFALTAVVGCLVSPVTWVHHLVWLLPALILLADNALLAPPGSHRRRRLLGFATVAYLVLCSRIVWLWEYGDINPLLLLGGNTYVWISLALLVALPIRDGTAVVADQPTEIGSELHPSPRPAVTVGRTAP